MRVPNILACVLVVGIASVASAGASAIKGTVLASDSLPLPGVTVTLEKCGMAPKTTYTGDAGLYSFQNLEPGTYNVTFSLEGFTQLRQEDIRVGKDEIVNLPIILRLGVCIDCFSEEPPVIDVHSSAVRYGFTQERFQLVPSKRDLWSVLDQTPGVDVGMSEDKRIR